MSYNILANELELCAHSEINWKWFHNKTVLISGATGMLGKYLISVLLKRNQTERENITILAIGRNHEKFRRRFQDISGADGIQFVCHDVNNPLNLKRKIDCIIHMASNTHPVLYATDPIGTEMTNIMGTYHLLELTAKNPGCRFVFTSSGDIYGDNRSNNEFLNEQDCGYIDCNTLRAGYIEGKRASEALCNAFKESKGIDFVIARLCRIYGPTMTDEDSKAITQFIRNAAKGQNIVLKSKGDQVFSYLYVSDAVTGLLKVISEGQTGEAYNIADNDNAYSLRYLAETIAELGGSTVTIDLPDAIEARGASSFKNVKLDGKKLRTLGWKAQVSLQDGLSSTIHSIQNSLEE